MNAIKRYKYVDIIKNRRLIPKNYGIRFQVVLLKSSHNIQLDEKDEEIAEALISLGLGRPVARTLAYLQHVNEAKSVELTT